ncbi:hypothetical protein AB6A40_001299 [Gnathostoma spinigerum]|uniref:Uncharacterized protein n=1 Tax=Gnathostoma spinigerum TaxID=75299 RepID=A0ABD6E4V0_9BILA
MNSHRDSYLDAVAQGDYTHLTETDHESSDKLTVKSQPAVMPTSVQLSHDASAVLPSRLVTRGASDLDISHRPQTTSANDRAKVRKCFDIFALQREMEEMKQALIFAKIQNTLLKNQLPNLTDSNGRDFSMEFLQCKNDLEMERRKRESLELERNSLASKLEAVETEQNIVDDYEAVIAQLKKERSLLVEKNSELQHDLFIKDAEIRRLNDAFACECPLVEESDSQDTTRSSSISIVSERDKLVDKLESQLAEIKLSQMKTDDQHKKEITAIQKSAADEIRNLKRRMEEREQDFECTRKKLINTYDERIGELQAVISKKDQAISALLNTNVKYPANDNLLTEGNKHLENYLPSASDINTDNSDSSATVASAFGYTQLMKEANERDRMIIARRTRVSGPCGSDGELQQKMKIFEETSSNASDSIRSEPAIAVAYTNCSELSSKNDQISFPVTTDIYNCSMDASFNLIGLRDKLHTLRKICSQLFDRLKGCAGTFQILLEELGKGDAGSKLLEEIEIIQCDLNTSTVQATDVFQQLKAAEQSIHELSYFLEKSMTLAGEGRYVGPDVLVDENMVEKMRTELTEKNAILHKVSAELEEAKVAIHSLKQAEEKARYEIRTYLTTIEGREIELKKAVEIIGERDSVIASLREARSAKVE